MRTMARSPAAGANVQNSVSRAEDAKSLVLAAIGQLVDGGKAEWTCTATGEIELRLSSGEAFLLGEVSVTRVA